MTADAKKLRMHNRRAVEGWIMGYQAAKEMIAELEQEMAEWAVTPLLNGLPRGTATADPTFCRAVKLSEVPEIAMSRRVVRAVEGVYARCGPTKKRVMEEYFFHRRPYLEVCGLLNVEKSAVYKYAGEIIREVAARLGVRV